MRKIFLFLFCCIPVMEVCSCSDYEEYMPEEDVLQERQMSVAQADEKLLDAVFHESSQSWVYLQGDPYRLENFQKVYDNLVLNSAEFAEVGEEEFAVKLRNVKKELAADTKKQLKLKPTHYAVKVLPKTEEEQRALEWDEQLKVAYVPFDYVSVPESQVSHIRMQRTGAVYHEEAEERRYTVTYEGGMDADGPTDPVTLELPVLYVVWPCDKPFPADMDYEVLYDVFLPQAPTASQKAQGLSAEALHVLESMAIDTIRHTGDIGRYPSGIISCYDNYLNKYVPLVYLTVRFSLGANIYEVKTDYNGYFSFKDPIFDNAVLSFVFDGLDGWKITSGGSSATIIESRGTYKSLRGSSIRDFDIQVNSSSVPDPRYEIYRAVGFYFYGLRTNYGSSSLLHLPEIDRFVDSTTGGMRIEAHTAAIQEGEGVFKSFLGNAHYIKIGNVNRNNQPRLMGTILHEMGHYTQFWIHRGYNHYNDIPKLLKESWASYAGWYMGELYYSVQRLLPIPFEDDITRQARQSWHPAMANPYYYYSPLFVDLRDNYNQCERLNNSRYANDAIKNVPYSLINKLARESSWTGVKKVLREHISSGYYTETQLNDFLVQWDKYFAANPL